MLNAFYALKGKYADKKKLADEAIYLERVLCNEAGGWQDQIAASFGGFNRINFNADGYEVLPVVISPERKKRLNNNLMMFFTGFTRFSSEKLFRGDKSYLGNKSIRVYSEESERAKIFVEFVAMILRCKMYIKLKEEMKKLEKKPNYMTVLEALKELEKIEMVRQLDNVYRLDHAVTANQKTILNAFGLDANHIKYYASELSKELKKAE